MLKKLLQTLELLEEVLKKLNHRLDQRDEQEKLAQAEIARAHEVCQRLEDTLAQREELIQQLEAIIKPESLGREEILDSFDRLLKTQVGQDPSALAGDMVQFFISQHPALKDDLLETRSNYIVSVVVDLFHNKDHVKALRDATHYANQAISAIEETGRERLRKIVDQALKMKTVIAVEQILSERSSVCAFRMALKDVESRNLSAAAHRIASDLDKCVDPASREILVKFIETYK